eukprot:COSAG01_NODE_19373_length_1013_cov_3.086433_1_plen_106_part_10
MAAVAAYKPHYERKQAGNGSGAMSSATVTRQIEVVGLCLLCLSILRAQDWLSSTSALKFGRNTSIWMWWPAWALFLYQGEDLARHRRAWVVACADRRRRRRRELLL